jgi:hypothetical protein
MCQLILATFASLSLLLTYSIKRDQLAKARAGRGLRK